MAEMDMSGSNEEIAVPDVLRPEATLIFSMSRIHLDAANRNKDKEANGAGGPPSPKVHRGRLRRCDDEERRLLLRKAHRNNRKQKDRADLQEALEELLYYKRRVQQRLREMGPPPPSPPRPATNGYTGRASIWAPEGFNPLLNLTGLLGPQQQHADKAAH